MHFDDISPLVLQSMPDTIPEVEVPWFLENATPRPHRCSVAKTMELLKDSGCIINGRWTWYPQDPSETGLMEDDVYQHVEDISDAVLVAANAVLPKGTKRTSRVLCRLRHTEKLESENGAHMSDANQMLDISRLYWRRENGQWCSIRIRQCRELRVQDEKTCSTNQPGTHRQSSPLYASTDTGTMLCRMWDKSLGMRHA